jgi:hypothetical protein
MKVNNTAGLCPAVVYYAKSFFGKFYFYMVEAFPKLQFLGKQP